MIQTVILAGGLGTRLLPRTETVAKPMVPVLSKPFLEHQIDLLRANGLTNILLLVSYLGDQIQAHFDSGHRFDVQIDYSWEQQPLGTGGALQNASSKLESDFLILNGDTLLDIDYRSFVIEFRQLGVLASLVASRKATAGFGNLLIAPDGSPMNYSKQLPKGGHVDAGVVAVRKEVLSLLPPDGKSSFEELVFPQLIERRELAIYQTPTAFFDMGTPDGLAALEAHLA